MKIRRKSELSKAYSDLNEHLERHKRRIEELTELEVRADIHDQKNSMLKFLGSSRTFEAHIQGVSRSQHGSSDWEAERSKIEAEKERDLKLFISRTRELYFGVADPDLRMSLIRKHCEIVLSYTYEAALKLRIAECVVKEAERRKRLSIMDHLSPAIVGVFCVYVPTCYARPSYHAACAIAGAVAGLFLGKAEMDRLKVKHDCAHTLGQNQISEAKIEVRKRQNMPLYFSNAEQEAGMEFDALTYD